MASFQVSPLFRETFAAKSQSNTALRSKVEQFLRVKGEDPTQPFGASDKPFKGGGFFSTAVPKIRHAHLTHDLSMVYTVEGGDPAVVRLYGIFSHDDLGTGQPQNINRQRGMATQLAGQSFSSQSEIVPAAAPAKKTKSEPGTSKFDYTPREKPAQPTVVRPLTQAVQSADALWSQRRLADRFDQAQGLTDQLAVINSEIQYLQVIMRKHGLYPNQQQYAQKLVQIYNLLTKRPK
jgi:mRNA-degrading endonuclease YafQ of YafQ-DinJ toxin-antitoxin module